MLCHWQTKITTKNHPKKITVSSDAVIFYSYY